MEFTDMWKRILVNRLMELQWGFHLISFGMRSPVKGIFKADDFKIIKGIIYLFYKDVMFYILNINEHQFI